MFVWVHLYPCILQIFSVEGEGAKKFLRARGAIEKKKRAQRAKIFGPSKIHCPHKALNDIKFGKEVHGC